MKEYLMTFLYCNIWKYMAQLIASQEKHKLEQSRIHFISCSIQMRVTSNTLPWGRINNLKGNIDGMERGCIEATNQPAAAGLRDVCYVIQVYVERLCNTTELIKCHFMVRWEHLWDLSQVPFDGVVGSQICPNIYRQKKREFSCLPVTNNHRKLNMFIREKVN